MDDYKSQLQDEYTEFLNKMDNGMRFSPVEKLTWRNKLKNKLGFKNILVRCCLAEFLATFFHMTFVQSTVASEFFAGRTNDILLHSTSQGLAVAFAVYVGGGVSGSFLNPAVNLAYAVLGKLSWINCILYSFAQYLAAFAAAALVYVVKYEAVNKYCGDLRETMGPNGTAGIFTTVPPEYRSVEGAFINEAVATMFLILGVLSICDQKNWRPDKGVMPLSLGLLVMLVNLGFSYDEGLALNPSRDLGPRLFLLVSGWGMTPITVVNYGWFWIPVAAAYTGGVVGGLVYTIFIEMHWQP